MGEDAAQTEYDEFPVKPDGETDLPPEFCHYKDEGCELAESCLNCPFDECVYDKPGGKQRWLKKARTTEIARLFTSEGKGIKELAGMFGISRRTVQRALKSALGSDNRRGRDD